MSGIGYTYGEEEEGDAFDEDDLGIDDSLSPLERLQKYCNSDLILHRLHLVRELSEIATQLGVEDTMEHVLPEMEVLRQDPEAVIRQALAEQLKDFAQMTVEEMGEKEKNEVMAGTIQPIVEQLVFDDHSQVRASVAETLVSLCDLLPVEEVKNYVIPIIEKLATNKKDEEHRIEATELLSKCAKPSPKDMVESFFVEQLLSLASDPMFRVRKATAIALGTVCSFVDTTIATDTLLPMFVRLTTDDIWGVRKACAETVIAITTAVTQEGRKALCGTFEKLLQDSSRWVRNSAFQHLGQFIASLEGKNVSDQLLSYYKGMVEGSKNKFGDSDTVLYCAFSFPGVLYTVGAEKWPILRDVYMTLVKDLQWKVRRTLSFSLHEVAKILGQEITEAELLDTFDLFLKDLDQVKVGVVRHFSEFLTVLSPAQRENYVTTLEDIQMSSVNWRFRKLIAKQLSKIAAIYEDDTVRMHIIPVFRQLFEDQVTAVRHATAKEAAALIKQLEGRDTSLLQDLLKDLVAFSGAKSCYLRQGYALSCEEIVKTAEDQKLFQENFWPKFLALKGDKVANIRIVVARTFTRSLLSNELFSDLHGEATAALEELSNDKDREVRYFSFLTPPDTLPERVMEEKLQVPALEPSAEGEDEEEPDLISA